MLMNFINQQSLNVSDDIWSSFWILPVISGFSEHVGKKSTIQNDVLQNPNMTVSQTAVI